MTLSSLISELVALDENQLTEDEYHYVADLIVSREGANLLVLGLVTIAVSGGPPTARGEPYFSKTLSPGLKRSPARSRRSQSFLSPTARDDRNGVRCWRAIPPLWR
jgi:hypothetical protein